jgi:hypothetical protein
MFANVMGECENAIGAPSMKDFVVYERLKPKDVFFFVREFLVDLQRIGPHERDLTDIWERA